MPIDLAGLYEAFKTGLATVPSAIIAAALLAGPTAVWLIARFVNPPDHGMTEELGPEELHWVCPHCRSINEDRIASCYRCHRLRADESVPLVIETAPTRSGPGVGIAVGPGAPVLAPDRSWIELEVARASDAVGDAHPPGEHRLAAASTSLGFEPIILEPRVNGSGHSAAAEPPRRRARRKPQSSDDSHPKRARKTGSG